MDGLGLVSFFLRVPHMDFRQFVRIFKPGLVIFGVMPVVFLVAAFGILPALFAAIVFFGDFRVDGVVCQAVAFAPVTADRIIVMVIITAGGYVVEM